MMPGNPTVGGTVLRIPALQSPNYVAGMTGWAIFQNGDAEFNEGTFRGYIIGGSLFIYSGTPAFGNPPVFYMSSASTDPEGNAITPGIFAGQPGSAQAGFVLNALAGILRFPVPGTLKDFGAVYAASLSLTVLGPQDAVGLDRELFQFNAGNGTASASLFLTYVDHSGGDNTQIQASYAGVGLPVVNRLNAVEPGTGTSPSNPAVPETWHTIPAWSGGNVLTGIARYQLTPDGEAEIEVDGSFSISGSPQATLPAAYAPANALNFPIYGGARANITTGGVLTIFSVTASSTVGFCQRIPLN